MNAIQVAFALGGRVHARKRGKLWAVHSLNSVGYGSTLIAAVLDCISRNPSPRGIA